MVLVVMKWRKEGGREKGGGVVGSTELICSSDLLMS